MKLRFQALGPCMLLLCAAMLIFSGCNIKNGYSHCPGLVNLRFVYTHNPESTDQFAQQVEHTDIFIFDSEGELHKSMRVQTSAMSNGNPQGKSVELDLPKGTYSIIAWSNLNDIDYILYFQNSLPSMMVELAAQQALVETRQSTLFHGMLGELVVVENERVSGVVEMIRDVNDVKVVLFQDQDVTRAIPAIDFSPYTVEITGCNRNYDYDNKKSAASDLSTYKPWSGYNPWVRGNRFGVAADMRVMRLFTDDDLYVVVRENGNVVHTRHLTTYITQNYQLCQNNSDLDRYYDFEVLIPFTADEIGDIVIGGDGGSLGGNGNGNGNGGGDLGGNGNGNGNGGGDLGGNGNGNGNGGGDLGGNGNNNGSGGGDIGGNGGSNGGGSAGGIGNGGNLNGK